MSTRIRLVVFLSTTLTAALVSAIAIDAIHRNLEERLEAHFPGLLERRATALERHLDGVRAKLAAEVGRERWRALHGTRREAAVISLETLLAEQPDLAGLALVTRGGRVVGRAGALATGDGAAEAAERAAGGTNASALLSLTDDETASLIATAIPSRAGDMRLVAAYDPEALREILRLDPDEGPGRVFLVDRSGRTLVADAPGGASPERPAHSQPDGLGNTTGPIEEYDAANGTTLVGSARPVGRDGWRLVVEAPVETVFAPLYSAVRRIGLLSAGIILAFGLIALRITRALVQPIEALSRSAARISRGDVDHEIPVHGSQDEIGLLTRSFNEMIRKLRRSQEEIEHDKLQLTEQNEELQRANEILAQLSITDGLTKLHNHRFFQDHLTREIKRVDRTGEPLSMLLLDLDDFKRLNDRHGHAAGDEVLMNIAGRLNENIRESDLLARYGGEEFVVLAPNTDIRGAVALAEKIRMSVESMPQIVDDSMRPIRVTVSCGVAQFQGDRKQFFHAADRALYRAKAEGKNCVVAAGDAD